MRLIDADELIVMECGGIKFVPKEFIDDAPTIEIVRCKECRYNVGLNNGDGFWEEDIVCHYWESDGLKADDFCSYGDRKTEPIVNDSQGLVEHLVKDDPQTEQEADS